MEVTEQTAAQQVRFAEQRLREVVARQLARTHGSAWESSELTEKTRQRLEAIKAQELLARPNARPEDHLLGYAGFDHLINVVHHHWPCCMESLRLWRSLEMAKHELERLQAARNPAMHGRDLWPHEYIEGDGAARRLRFEIEGIWRREANVTGEYWLYMEQAEDSLGNRSTSEGSSITVTSAKVLYVGDTVHVKARAFDPHGRELRYRLQEYLGSARQASTEWGIAPEFEWTASQVAREVRVDVDVKADGDPHANPGAEYDAFARFVYEVRPRL